MEIAYTALSLSIPERVQFRYKLEGIDKDWQDPGTRRLAFYAHLPAGQHRFKVIASNNDGVCNDRGAAIDFRIAPAFYETWYFRAAIGMLALLIIWWGVRSRIKRIRRQLEARHAERLSERERIARELHDTLLQSLVGVMLQFQSSLDLLSATDPTRMSLSKTLDTAEAVMQEGRERVRNLRTRDGLQSDLGQSLSAIAHQLRVLKLMKFELHIAGLQRELKPAVQEEILLIGREALTNAFVHAAAKAIRVEIVFQRRKISLSVVDDGCGIHPQVLEAGGRENHWGLIGMRERAARLKGTLEVTSKADKGTRVELSVPGQMAYQDPTALTALLHFAWFRSNGRNGVACQPDNETGSHHQDDASR